MNKAANLKKIKDLITGKRLDKAKELHRDVNIDQFIHNRNVKRPSIQRRVRRNKNISPEYLDNFKYKEKRQKKLESIVDNLEKSQTRARLGTGAVVTATGISLLGGKKDGSKNMYEEVLKKAG
jgi:hypothetical protein